MGCCCTPIPVVPVVILSLLSCTTASAFRCLNPESSVSRAICAFALASCAFKSSVEVGTAFATLLAAFAVVFWTVVAAEAAFSEIGADSGGARVSGAVRWVWGVTASGAGEP